MESNFDTTYMLGNTWVDLHSQFAVPDAVAELATYVNSVHSRQHGLDDAGIRAMDHSPVSRAQNACWKSCNDVWQGAEGQATVLKSGNLLVPKEKGISGVSILAISYGQ